MVWPKMLKLTWSVPRVESSWGGSPPRDRVIVPAAASTASPAPPSFHCASAQSSSATAANPIAPR